MTLDIQRLQAKTTRITVTFADEDFHVWYRPHSITPKIIKRIEESGDSIGSLLETLGVFVSEWDILDEHGQRIPPTSDTVALLPAALLNQVVSAIMEDLTNPAGSDTAEPTLLAPLHS